MDGMGLKGEIMYDWVTDKKFIKETYSTCADIVNQLVQRLNKEGINSYFFDIGSKRRNMITRNGKAPIDFDFNLFIENGMRYNCKELKEYIMNINKNIRIFSKTISVHIFFMTINIKYFKVSTINKIML